MYPDNDEYRLIFNQRAGSYHQAMIDCPFARDPEFQAMAEFAAVMPGDRVCDMPSGGGYLNRFLDPDADIISIETSYEFANLAPPRGNRNILLCEFDNIPLASDSIDKIICLAALHHVIDKQPFFNEAFRIIKPGGTLCLADVQKGSGIVDFLDIFVDQHNSMGHQGHYLDENSGTELQNAGFSPVAAVSKDYGWRFDSLPEMGRFCKMLFGIDQAGEDVVLEGIRNYLGTGQDGRIWYLNWGLYFLKAEKPARTGT